VIAGRTVAVALAMVPGLFLIVALSLGVLLVVLPGCSREPAYDVVIRNGTVYDGSGRLPFRGDLAILGDTIAALGQRVSGSGRLEIEARGMAVAPGFINMLSWANESLIQDGRSESDIRQGVTLEVFGEGETMGPLNDAMKREMLERQSDITYEIEWTTLGEYLTYLERRGISPNVASFVGATTVRVHELGYENRAPTPNELERMKQLVRQAMEEGAFGVGSSLIYAPAFYARTDELIALAGAAAPYGGMYISHLRGEGAGILGAIEELLAIARGANVPAEIYHLKVAGEANWHLIDSVLARIEKARGEGLAVTADMYTYTAAATGLESRPPPEFRICL
jgi:N-acyl-D-amino-acid deacylase